MFNGKSQSMFELNEEVENGKFDEEVLKVTLKFNKKKKWRVDDGDDVREFSGNVNEL